MPPPTYFPLRWESTGDQWWFASPIDWAAANGHYDVVRELLHIDTNLLIKLTSLPRIRRLETVWDDEEKFNDVAKCRAQVAYKLLQECETKKGHNSLIRAGYGGWLLYTAASAGDVGFVKELLGREPFLVFGEGEYGLTDVFYAAARGKRCEVFRLLLESAVSPQGRVKDVLPGFKDDVMNRAVHAACRGGNLEMLKELLGENGNVLCYKDGQGSNVLHSAAGRGQVEVVKYLISSYNVINAPDNQGNVALHIAAYRGHLPVVEALLSTSPSLATVTNKYGDTFLHMAVSGFCAPSFRRMDRLRSLMKELVGGKLVQIEDVVNLQNKEGRTALHMAVIDNIQSDIVELLMSVRYINLNIRDADGNTPLDILKQHPQSASSEILIKRLISAGGISDWHDRMARKAILSHLKTHHGIGASPGTSFGIPDAEIFLHAGIEDQAGYRSSDSTSIDYRYSGEIEHIGSTPETSTPRIKKFGSMNNATRRLKNVLRWPGKKDKNADSSDLDDPYCSSVESFRTSSGSRNAPVPLRQQFSRNSSLLGNKRISSFPANLPSPSAKKKFAAGLSQGVLQVHHSRTSSYLRQSPSSVYSESPRTSPAGTNQDNVSVALSESDIRKMKRRHGSLNLRLMNKYLCFGAHGISIEKSILSPRGKPDQGSLVA